ncbi:hypothetical protein OG994_25855 [Micromonospora globbae]|uniref:Uncharacterized protein n=1 Tax=Micromonospora globbae TaxID=1894969 RepID=A0ABZ1S4K9_9ACTN|nr:hypothetical protein [Micromonospora globbae]
MTAIAAPGAGAPDLVQISVSVPANRVSDLYAFVATLHGPIGSKEVPKVEYKGAPVAQRALPGFGKATVRKNYLGGVSDYWRPFLERLAEEPDEWVSWTVLCEAIGLTPHQASGMLGAAERRCKGYPPYEKSGYTEGDHWFRMPKEVAEIIKELAAE